MRDVARFERAHHLALAQQQHTQRARVEGETRRDAQPHGVERADAESARHLGEARRRRLEPAVDGQRVVAELVAENEEQRRGMHRHVDVACRRQDGDAVEERIRDGCAEVGEANGERLERAE